MDNLSSVASEILQQALTASSQYESVSIEQIKRPYHKNSDGRTLNEILASAKSAMDAYEPVSVDKITRRVSVNESI